MNKKKLNVVGMDTKELGKVIGDVFDTKMKEQKDKEIKEEHVESIFKSRESKRSRKESGAGSNKEHKHFCPSCHSSLKDVGKNFEVCEDCGDKVVTFKKDDKLLLCSDCGNVVSQSAASCPNCGGKKARWE